MSGIEYPPPREDVPIFDPLLFLEQEFGPLTEAIADTKYLRFPFAQGTENLAIVNVNGLATFFDALTHQGAGGENFTTNQNIIMNGAVGKFIQFPDGTQQTTASGGIPPLIPDPTGTYTNATVQVNDKGQVITASSGAGSSNIISTQVITANQNITFPVGTQYATLMVSGAGGASGGSFFDASVPSVTAGGAGGAGGCAIIDRLPMKAGTNMVCAFSNSNGTCSVGYLSIVNTVYTFNVPLLTANAGAGGITAVSTGGNPAGGTGGTISVSFTPMGYGLQGGAGGAGQQSSGTFAILQGINFLSTLNANMVLSTVSTPFNYGAGGYTRINNGSVNDVSINGAGSAVCIVISYSS